MNTDAPYILGISTTANTLNEEYFKFLNRLYDITWFGAVYA